MRLGEMIALRQRDVRDGQVVIGAAGPTKTYRSRIVPVPADLAAQLPADDPDAPLFPRRGARQWIRRMQRLTADLPVFGELPGRRTGNQWHLLRSTFAVRQARAGTNLWQLMSLLGHTNPQTTMRYVNLAGVG